MSLKQTIRHQLNARGIEIIGYRHTVRALRHAILAAMRVATVIDVGANIGQYGKEIRRAGFTRRIHSLEPVPDAFETLLRTSANDSHWTCERLAVSDEQGTMMFNVSKGSIFSSALEVNDVAIDASHDAKPRAVLEIPADTLDNIVGRLELSCEAPLAVKIDVQGFERNVLNGGTRTLESAAVVEIELSPQELYKGQMLLAEALERLSSIGFVLSLVENLFPDPATRRSLQFNGIFVRP
jgi:FkbM family methyltransferase